VQSKTPTLISSPPLSSHSLNNSLLPLHSHRYTNSSIDFGISHNQWPVRFQDASGVKTELVTKFALHFWVKYLSFMKPQPLPQSAIAQKVLKYILVHPDLLVKTWRNRLYYYSSGSTFQAIATDLVLWMSRHEPPSDEEASESQGVHVEKILKKVSDSWCHMCVCHLSVR